MSDCFESDTLISVAAMQARVAALTPAPVGSETLGLRLARDRILAREVLAAFALPRYTAAAMDGIAFAAASPRRLRIVGEALAGHPWCGRVLRGEAVRITTGAPLPEGCDSVEMVERLSFDGDDVEMVESPSVGQHVRYAGEEIAVGERVFEAGTPLGPARLGMLASLGLAEVVVHRRPRVALFSTGDELRRPNAEESDDGTLFDANGFSLTACLERWGADVVHGGTLADSVEQCVAAFSRAVVDADLVITSGGISKGESDLVRRAVGRLGEVSAWRVAVRPGKPMALGSLMGRPFFGLPGNPVAALVTLERFVQPLVRCLAGRTDWHPQRWWAVTEAPLHGRKGRLDLLRGRYHIDDSGNVRVGVLAEQGSHRLSSLYLANCLIELPEDVESADAGTLVALLPLDALL
ncbi:molybdopterin molybdotransferase MoeA [Kushneria aurantia]|uniref:Molybdopterin molybdenumtransferase n=1 Tax=Kushneria aurantia TaxID=504092 RepID=A0ABV6G2W8_9GAMM|nr:gephyrin-like molybdotransferase Glp [Kushneria aurantia]